MNTNDYDFGHWAEYRVAEYLKDRGYKIFDKNYKKPWGEIDIIAEKDHTLIFIEVKASKNPAIGFEPENRAGKEKLKRVYRAAQTYLSSNKHSPNQDWQIDIIALTLNKEERRVKIKHFKNVDL